MAKLVYALNQSLDGYVDHMKFQPDPVLFRHFTEDVRSLAGNIYGRRMYLHPVVLGSGKPYFAGPRPRLRLVADERIGEDVIRLTYVPA